MENTNERKGTGEITEFQEAEDRGISEIRQKEFEAMRREYTHEILELGDKEISPQKMAEEFSRSGAFLDLPTVRRIIVRQ